jgi:putative membrane protein
MRIHVRAAFVAGLLAAAAFPLAPHMDAWAQSSGGSGSGSGGAGSGGTGSGSGTGSGAPTGSGTSSGTGTTTGPSGSGNTGTATTTPEGGAGTQRTMPGANSTGGTQVNRNRTEGGAAQGTRPTSPMQRVNTQDYLNQVASSDMFEIASSQLALERSSNAEVQAFARKMVADHQQASQRVNQALSTGGSNNLRPPGEMLAEHQRMIERLRNAERGAAFDRMYLQMQVRGHEQALALHRSYGNTGDNVALQVVAKEMTPVVEQHLAEVRRLANKDQSRKPGERERRRSSGS